MVTLKPAFQRSEVTWAAYLLLGYFAYQQTVLGPVMPFLRRELNLSYGESALHFSAFAAGMVVAGLTGDRVAAALGRRATLWGGAAGMALGGIALIAGGRLPLTLAGAGLMGLCGALLLVTIQAVLADAHGPLRSQALTEANVVASSGSSLAALAVGASVGIGLGWRPAIGLALAIVAVVALAFRRAAIPERSAVASRAPAGERGGRLPARYWVYWTGSVLSVSAEWCVAYWGTDYLHQVGGLTASAAALVMGGYLGVTVVARVAGSRLTRTFSSASLLIVAAATALAGFLVFWLAPGGPLTVAGLCLAGLGIANLFPLGLATAMGLASTHPDTGSARLSMGGGLAILTAPLALGALADRVGLHSAYAVALVFLLSVVVLTTLARLVPTETYE